MRDGQAVVVLVTVPSADAGERIARAVSAFHPYTVPEVLALPVLGGHAPYLAWLRGAVGRSERGGGDQPDQE